MEKQIETLDLEEIQETASLALAKANAVFDAGAAIPTVIMNALESIPLLIQSINYHKNNFVRKIDDELIMEKVTKSFSENPNSNVILLGTRVASVMPDGSCVVSFNLDDEDLAIFIKQTS